MATLWRPLFQSQPHWDTLSEVPSPTRGFLRHHQQHPGQLPGGTRSVVEVKETPEAYQLFMDLPGMKQQEVIVRLEPKGRLLCISGEKARQAVPAVRQGHQGAAGGLFHRVERDAGGKFERRFHIPDDADLGAIRSSLVNGVLFVTVPKMEKPQELRDIDFA